MKFKNVEDLSSFRATLDQNSSVHHQPTLPSLPDEVRRVMRNIGKLDPLNLNDYLAVDGFCALEKVLSGMTPEAVISEVKKSGLRGRGGAGFSTGLKWQFAMDAEGSTKYVLCNGEEGDPGLFVNRSVLEGDPYAIIEAMTIAAYAIGAVEGIIYLNAEYKEAAGILKHALEEAGNTGLLGDNILGSSCSFDIRIVIGPKRYICGEETAQIASIEGKREEPNACRPIIKGLHEKPTLVNNVETFANIPLIIHHGAGWFTEAGTENSTGTKVLSLKGSIHNTAEVEVPFGMSFKAIINSLGGGTRGDRSVRAVMLGGPMGACIPADKLYVRLAHADLAQLGAGVGAGEFEVLCEGDSVFEAVQSRLAFCQQESCGKCTSCRIGTRRMLEAFKQIESEEISAGDKKRLQKLGRYMQTTSYCGMGRSAANTVLDMLHHFY